MGGDALDEAVVGVGAGVGAGEAFEARVAGDAVGGRGEMSAVEGRQSKQRDAPKGDAVPRPEFFEFCHHAVCYTGYT